MASTRTFPTELAGITDPRLYQRLLEIFDLIHSLQDAQTQAPQQVAKVVQRQLQLLGVLREPLLGAEVADPQLAAAASTPGGAVTLVTGSSGSNITVTITNPTTTPNVGVTISATPSFTSVDSISYKVAGTKVVGLQQPAIADPTGGGTIDVEARTSLIDLLNAIRTHGLIDT